MAMADHRGITKRDHQKMPLISHHPTNLSDRMGAIKNKGGWWKSTKCPINNHEMCLFSDKDALFDHFLARKLGNPIGTSTYSLGRGCHVDVRSSFPSFRPARFEI